MESYKKKQNENSTQMHQYWNKRNFKYKKYKEAQVSLNKKKIKLVWVTKEDIEFISQFIKGKGICHGARNGFEIREFSKYYKTIGTDISDTANEYGLIEWDFHIQNPEWIGKFDFVYTNSIDHSYNPRLALKIFREQLKKGGICIVHTPDKMETMSWNNRGDCFGGTKEELTKLLGAKKVYTFNERNIFIIEK